jgi:hypothetical protein
MFDSTDLWPINFLLTVPSPISIFYVLLTKTFYNIPIYSHDILIRVLKYIIEKKCFTIFVFRSVRGKGIRQSLKRSIGDHPTLLSDVAQW